MNPLSPERHLRILAYGFPIDGNFGGPSVVHGLYDALAHVAPGSELVVYQQRKLEPLSVADAPCPVRYYPYQHHVLKFLRDGLLSRVTRWRSRGAATAQFWDDFRAADVVVNIYAICFYAAPGRESRARALLSCLKAAPMLLRSFGVGVMARLWGKRALKTTSSYGPFGRRTDAFRAWLACRFAFTRALAREEEGGRRLRALAPKRMTLSVAPDLANAWRPEPVARSGRPRIGVAISFQSERQWARKGRDYMPFMRALAVHALTAYGACEIVLLPNQIKGAGARSDDTILAQELFESLGRPAQMRVFDTAHVPPTALRAEIAACDLVVSCRYHTCVAAFASGVPTLVIGWHEKYAALGRLYGQERWMFSTEACAQTDMCAVLDALWAQRHDVARDLVAHGPAVRAAVETSLRQLLET